MNIHKYPLLSNILSDTKLITQQKFIFIGGFSTKGNTIAWQRCRKCLILQTEKASTKEITWQVLWDRTTKHRIWHRLQKVLLNDKEVDRKSSAVKTFYFSLLTGVMDRL